MTTEPTAARYPCDMHCHTVRSDGNDTPQELIENAARLGLLAIGITDRQSIKVGYNFGASTRVGQNFSAVTAAYQALWATTARLAGPLRDVMSAKRVGVAVEGFSVPHVHVHIVPLYAFDDLNPSRARALDAAEADRLHALIRGALAAVASGRV